MEGLYTLRVRGERGCYEFRGHDNLSLTKVCEVVSDLTQYRTDYIEREVKHLGINQAVGYLPANSINGGPNFEIKRIG